MKLDEFYSLLCSTGISVVYRAFEENEVPPLPYIVYYEDSKSSFYADNINYFFNARVSVELYAEKRDKALEKKLEDLFRENHITYADPIEYYWDDERLFEKLYEVVL